MNPPPKRLIVLLAVLLAFMVFIVAPAGATTVYLYGVNYPSDISATVEFNYVNDNPTTGHIDLDVSNTSSITSSLTGFAFNSPSAVTGASPISSPDGWSVVFNPNDINSPGNFGYFDIADITGPNLPGGKPANGIWDGDSASFIIGLTGTGMGGLNDMSFLSLLSDLNNSGTAVNFIARFQALPGGGSDVAVVPIPPTVLLMGSGLLGLGLLGWRRRKS
jgi:hypothetical protein